MPGKTKKVIYTVITDRYDHLFPPLVAQDGWDLVCFTDDDTLQAEGWQVRPLPELPELATVQGDAVRTARLVKILPHRFLANYDYSLYMDGNRILAQKAEVFVQDGSEDILCLKGRFVDAYAAVDALLLEEAEDDVLPLSQKKPLDDEDKAALQAAAKRWKKDKLPEYGGCPGTALLGRRHNEEAVKAVMESWAGEVLAGLAQDEPALPWACHKHDVVCVQRLGQTVQDGWIFSEAERLAPAMQHVRMGQAEPFEKPVYEKNPPPPGGQYDGYPYLLTIGVPVSNQIGTIKRCLDGIKPILDALPAELLVVDTGSTDGTVEVCRQYGARVVAFPWIGDMSAARNTGIRAAKGSWYMSIDDDEWFEDASPIIEFFKTGGHKKYNMALYNQRNFKNKNMTENMEFPTPRIGKMTPGLHFEGRIHDLLNQEGEIKRAYLAAVANHLGFAQDDEIALKEKSRRNVRILKQEVVHYPEDMRFANQLVKEYMIAERREDSLRMVYWIMSLAQNAGGHAGNPHWVKVNKGRALRNLAAMENNGEEAAAFFEKFVDLAQYNYLDSCLVHSALVLAYGKMGQRDVMACHKSVAHAKDYFADRKQYFALKPDMRDLQWSGVAHDSVGDGAVLEVATTVLAACRMMYKYEEADAFVLGKEMAAYFCEEANQDYRQAAMEYLAVCRRFAAMQTLLMRFAKENGRQGLDYPYAMVCEQMRPEDAKQVRAIVEHVDGKDAPFLAMLGLLEMDIGHKKAKSVFEKAMDYVKGTLFVPGHYFRGRLLHEAFRLQLDAGAVMDLLDRSAADYVIEAIRENEGGWRRALSDEMRGWWQTVGQNAPSLQRYLAFHVAEMDFREKELNRQLEPQAYADAFAEYVRRRYAWEKEQAAEGLMDGDGSAELQADLRAVCAAQHALDLMEAGQNTEAMRSLKVVIEQEPSYKHAVMIWNEQLVAETEQQLNRMSELDTLLAGIKPRLQQLLAAGQVAEVKAMLAQLEVIAPNDKDLIAMKKQLGLLPPS